MRYEVAILSPFRTFGHSSTHNPRKSASHKSFVCHSYELPCNYHNTCQFKSFPCHSYKQSSYKSFACHSYEKHRGGTHLFPKWNPFSPVRPLGTHDHPLSRHATRASEVPSRVPILRDASGHPFRGSRDTALGLPNFEFRIPRLAHDEQRTLGVAFPCLLTSLLPYLSPSNRLYWTLQQRRNAGLC